MASIKVELSKSEAEMLIICIDSAIDVIDLSEEEMERMKNLKEELIKHL